MFVVFCYSHRKTTKRQLKGLYSAIFQIEKHTRNMFIVAKFICPQKANDEIYLQKWFAFSSISVDLAISFSIYSTVFCGSRALVCPIVRWFASKTGWELWWWVIRIGFGNCKRLEMELIAWMLTLTFSFFGGELSRSFILHAAWVDAWLKSHIHKNNSASVFKLIHTRHWIMMRHKNVLCTTSLSHSLCLLCFFFLNIFSEIIWLQLLLSLSYLCMCVCGCITSTGNHNESERENES